MPLRAGLSFSPSGASSARPEGSSGPGALAPSQRALQILSLHLPKILGTRAVSPSSLLTPHATPVGPVSPESAVLQSALRAFGPGGLPAFAPPASPQVSPLAAVTPPPMAALMGAPSLGGVAGPLSGGGDDIQTLLRALGQMLGGQGGPPNVTVGDPIAGGRLTEEPQMRSTPGQAAPGAWRPFR